MFDEDESHSQQKSTLFINYFVYYRSNKCLDDLTCLSILNFFTLIVLIFAHTNFRAKISVFARKLVQNLGLKGWCAKINTREN